MAWNFFNDLLLESAFFVKQFKEVLGSSKSLKGINKEVFQLSWIKLFDKEVFHSAESKNRSIKKFFSNLNLWKRSSIKFLGAVNPKSDRKRSFKQLSLKIEHFYKRKLMKNFCIDRFQRFRERFRSAEELLYRSFLDWELWKTSLSTNFIKDRFWV